MVHLGGRGQRYGIDLRIFQRAGEIRVRPQPRILRRELLASSVALVSQMAASCPQHLKIADQVAAPMAAARHADAAPNFVASAEEGNGFS